MNPPADPQLVKQRVLDFYRTLAFNRHSSAHQQIQALRAHDPVQAYPVLQPLLRKGLRVLEVGSGTGWLSNGMSHHHQVAATGIDMNPDAVSFSRQVAQQMGVPTQFECADLFSWQPKNPFPLVVSLGVLHHTHNCLAAVRRLCSYLLAPGGHALFGLYHLHGRRPFLDYFSKLQRSGATEAAMLARYRELHELIADDTHALSWFRDQVLHPHETQHTLREMAAPLAQAGCEVISTSINGFEPLPDGLTPIYDQEPSLEMLARERLRENRYYPGFFLFLVRKAA